MQTKVNKIAVAVGAAIVAAGTFAISPAGMALVHQYPKLSAVSAIVLALGGLLTHPTTPVQPS
jgi:hypothetical protein